MTAATMARKRKRPTLLLVALVLMVLPPICGHAVRRHGDQARSAYCWLLSCDPDAPEDAGRLWHGVQEDGRDVYVYELPRLPGRPVTWAIAIVGGGFLVTAFLSQSRRSVERMKRKCGSSNRTVTPGGS